jgi:putative peptide zinc metalloprotease protein
MMSLSKVVHELGHALAANHFGCRVPAMGFALLLGMPVLWTDVTDSWRLPHRRERLIIDAAGMIAEMTLAVLATILWSVLPDGAVRSGAYMLASTAWLITLGINLNPFMRFDGYYLLADSWDIPNLQDRSFALAKWQLRESLFGFGFEPPEHWPKTRHRFLMIYAVSVWIYRLVLFTGIAWAVYYFFFKALGLFLFAVEIGWFIIKPIWNEVSVWPKLIGMQKAPIRPRRSWLIPLAIIAALFIPWRSHLLVPGIYLAEAENTFYCVEPAQVKEVLIKEGDQVKAGQVLVKLASPDVDYKILAAELKSREIQERLSLQSLEPKLAYNNPKDFEELQSALAELAGFREVKQKLTVRATFDGRIRDLSDVARPGEWLAKDEPIGIVESQKANAVAYVEEADLPVLEIGADGWFYPEGGDLPRIPVNIASIDKTGTRELKVEELASVYGGEVAVRPDKNNKESDKRLVPEQGIYRVLLSTSAEQLPQKSTIRGRLALTTEAQSIAKRFIRLATVMLVKESGW